jgi:hypothetical protein
MRKKMTHNKRTVFRNIVFTLLICFLVILLYPSSVLSMLLIDESFDSGTLPLDWSVIDNVGQGYVWRFDNPGGRTNFTGGTGSFAIADSDNAGSFLMDTELRTVVMDMTNIAGVILQFKTDFYYYAGGGTEVADVDVSVNGASGPWTNVWTKSGADYRGPQTESIDITSEAAGQGTVMIRFRYYNANYDWWWQVDDVLLEGCFDADGDGYGNPGHSSCPNGSTPDCNDADNTVYPSAPELCDGQNNACSGGVPANETDDDTDGYVECTIDAGGWDGILRNLCRR